MARDYAVGKHKHLSPQGVSFNGEEVTPLVYFHTVSSEGLMVMRYRRNKKETRILYSVYVDKGPDRIHFDLLLAEDKLIAMYLGEYWERLRPRSGLGKRVDLQIYRIRKRRRREVFKRGQIITMGEDIVISICDVKEISMKRIEGIVQLIVKTSSKAYVFNTVAKIYPQVREFVKSVQKLIKEKCRR